MWRQRLVRRMVALVVLVVMCVMVVVLGSRGRIMVVQIVVACCGGRSGCVMMVCGCCVAQMMIAITHEALKASEVSKTTGTEPGMNQTGRGRCCTAQHVHFLTRPPKVPFQLLILFCSRQVAVVVEALGQIALFSLTG